MEQIEIGLWVTAGLLVLVVAGMRVAFGRLSWGSGPSLDLWAKKTLIQRNLDGRSPLR